MTSTHAKKTPTVLILEARAVLVDDLPTAKELAQQAWLMSSNTGNVLHQAESLWVLGQCSQQQMRLEEAIGYFERACKGFAAFPESPAGVECRIHLARVQIDLGEIALAIGNLKIAVKASQALGAHALEAMAVNALARIHSLAGQPFEALGLLERAIELFDVLEDPKGKAFCLHNVATIYTQLGHFQQALEYLERVRALIDEHHLAEPEHLHLTAVANIYEGLNDNERTLQYHQAALEVAIRQGNKNHEAISRLNLGELAQRIGQHEEALEWLKVVQHLARQSGLIRWQVIAEIGISKSLIQLDRLAEARTELVLSLRTAQQLDDVPMQLEALLALSSVHEGLGQAPEAQTLLEEALALAQRHSSTQHVMLAHQRLADVLEGANPALALQHFRAYHQLREDLFEQRDRNMRDLQVRLETEAFRKANATLEAKVHDRTQELEEAYAEMLERLTRAAEYRDDDTGQHTERVGRLSAHIALVLGWSEDQVRLLEQAATLHDVGKIGIPDEILLKPGRFTPEEFAQMKTHTTIGGSILGGARFPLMQLAETIALSHHERWDGSGYPSGLRGEDIPLAGRIVTVADVFDALTNERPYKKAWSHADAIAEIEKQAGTQFDPAVVRAFMQVIRSGFLSGPHVDPGV